MDPYYRNQSAIVLFVSSLQTLSLSSAMISYYNTKPKDAIYNWAVASLICSILSLIMAIAAFLGWYFPYFYQAWVMLFINLSLVLTVLATVLYPAPSAWLSTLWVFLFVLCTLANGFGSYAVIPLSERHDYGSVTVAMQSGRK